MGNPPFYGARMQSKEQKADIQNVFYSSKNSGNIDYVAGWYMKAAEYMKDWQIRAAYVSTNSICQGEQVANIWQPINDLGLHIDFAHDTFRWRNAATEQAHVYVVIIGFSKLNVPKTLFHHVNPDSEAEIVHPNVINAYLLPAPNVFVWNRVKPMSDIPPIGIGSQPIDDGNYLFSEKEMEDFVETEPNSKPFFHPWLGSQEFINGSHRYVLWLGNASKDAIDQMPKVKQRVEAVRLYRLNSKRTQTRKAAESPEHFGTEIIAESNAVIIPETSSERRHYIPIGFIGPDTFCSNAVRLVPNASIYHFGVLHSHFHNSWMRAVAGRLESRYRYSAGMVYNTFVWPNPTPEQKSNIESCAQRVLDARDNHAGDSLATLYDPDKMPDDLFVAHQALDAAVEEAYGVSFHGDEKKIVAHLFKLYEEAIWKEQDDKTLRDNQAVTKRNAKPLKATVKVKVKAKAKDNTE